MAREGMQCWLRIRSVCCAVRSVDNKLLLTIVTPSQTPSGEIPGLHPRGCNSRKETPSKIVPFFVVSRKLVRLARRLALHKSIFLSNTDQTSCCDTAGLPALTSVFAVKPAFLLGHTRVHLL